MKLSIPSFNLVIRRISSLVILGFISLNSCDCDDYGSTTSCEDSPIIGEYVLIDAILQEDITIQARRTDVVPGDTASIYRNVPISAGTAIDEFVKAVLFNTAPVCSDNSTGIALQSNCQSKIVCISTGSKNNQGDWKYKTDTKVLTLKIRPPVTSSTYTIPIDNVSITGSRLTGIAPSFPLPKNTDYDLGDELPDGSSNLQNVSIQITLNRENQNTGS